LGDCWFLSAVAVLTDVSRISDVIITPQYNEEGIYTVRFCIQVILQALLLVLTDSWLILEISCACLMSVIELSVILSLPVIIKGIDHQLISEEGGNNKTASWSIHPLPLLKQEQLLII